MTIYERIDELEAQMRDVRVRLGMELPNVSGLTPEQIEDQKRRGIIPVGVGAASKSTLPGQVPELSPGWSRTIASVRAMREPSLTPAEALTHYGGESQRVFFSEPIKVIDADDLRAIQYEKGWHSVPVKHLSQLKGRAQWDSEAVAQNQPHPTPNADAPPST